jgi:hypothetical protein
VHLELQIYSRTFEKIRNGANEDREKSIEIVASSKSVKLKLKLSSCSDTEIGFVLSQDRVPYNKNLGSHTK